MKIAFCFLIYDFIIRYDIWNSFFKNIDTEKYCIFIHPKKLLYNKNYESYTFPYNIVKNIIETKSKDHISIVRAILQLLKETYQNNENITHFIFLSQSCIPLYSFDILYQIISNSKYSIISSINNNRKERYYQLSTIIKRYINYESFVKQQPNMILIRDDMKLLLENDYTNHFNNISCPDEHYFINILNSVLKKKIIKRQVHFCNYNFEKTQSLEFYNIDKIFIEKIRNYGFLFMRKVNKNSNIDVHFLLNLR